MADDDDDDDAKMKPPSSPILPSSTNTTTTSKTNTSTTNTTNTTTTTTNTTMMNTKTNIIVMSDAGKPIFARYGSEEEISKLCGLIQAVRTAINNNSTSSTLRLGEIQSLHSNDLCMVFMTIGSITLLSISSKSKNNNHNNNNDHDYDEFSSMETESFCRLRLEYVYAQLIFTLTEQVQSIYVHNPSFDLRSTMSSSESLLRGILDKSGPDQDLGLFLMAGVQSLYPISHRIRYKASKVVQTVAGRPDNNIAFALLVAGRDGCGGSGNGGIGGGSTGGTTGGGGGGDRLLTVVQPSYRPHQLRISDLHLILNFVGKQQQQQQPQQQNQPPSSKGGGWCGISSELWVPMCLPRFNSNGFLYAYICCLDVPSQLTLVLLSSHGTTEQFQILRSSSQQIRTDLGLPQVSDSVITIVATANNDNNDDDKDDENDIDDKVNDDGNIDDVVATDANVQPTTIGSDVGWTRNDESTSFDDDYVNISIHGNEVVVEKKDDLLYQVRYATQLSTMEHICKKYLDDEESLIHFLFRLDVPIITSKGNKPRRGRGNTPHHPSTSGGGNLSQCISPTIDNEPYCDSSFRRRLWCNYQKLSLRLRLGSATVESAMDAYDMINASCREDEEADDDNVRAKSGLGQQQQQQQQHGHFPGIGKHCPTMGLFESPPYNPDGLSYIIQGDETFLAMNGKNFELYMTTTNSIPVKRAAAIGTKLVRGLTSDEKSLFLTKPLTWRD